MQVTLKSSAINYKKIAVWAVVILSLAWTIMNWSSTIGEVKSKISEVAFFGTILLISEALFVVGAILVTYGAGKEVFAGTGIHPLGWIRAAFDARKHLKELAVNVRRNPQFAWGFRLNTFAAVASSAILLIGLMVVLPVASWGPLLPISIDLAATFGWRLPVLAKFKSDQSKKVMASR